MTVTVGIDLASQPRRTALAAIRWDTSGPVLLELGLGRNSLGAELNDRVLLDIILGSGDCAHWPPVSKVGIDAPFGWPRLFVDALPRYAESMSWPADIDAPRERFYRRSTDRVVSRETEVTPLAVSVDRIGYCAIRCAAILSSIAQQRGAGAAARDGTGLVCEVYPDPALRHWVRHSDTALGRRDGYKGKQHAALRARLLQSLLDELPLSDPHGLLVAARESPADDYIDALLAALVARACETAQTRSPTAAEQADARAEGWIHIPTASIGELG